MPHRTISVDRQAEVGFLGGKQVQRVSSDRFLDLCCLFTDMKLN